MIGVDTNILIADSLPDHPDHAKVRRKLDSLLTAGCQLALPSMVFSEFIHVATDSRRFREPLSAQEAVAQAELWSASAEVVLLSVDELVHWQWLRWLTEHRLGRKRLLDTLLAATWHAAGVREILTLNPRDFEIFGVFTLLAIESGDPPEGS